MKVDLNSQLGKLVNEKVKSGRYRSPRAVVEVALQLLRERDEQELEALRKDLQHAMDQVKRGEYMEYNERTIKNLTSVASARGRRRLGKERKIGAR